MAFIMCSVSARCLPVLCGCHFVFVFEDLAKIPEVFKAGEGRHFADRKIRIRQERTGLLQTVLCQKLQKRTAAFFLQYPAQIIRVNVDFFRCLDNIDLFRVM